MDAAHPQATTSVCEYKVAHLYGAWETCWPGSVCPCHASQPHKAKTTDQCMRVCGHRRLLRTCCLSRHIPMPCRPHLPDQLERHGHRPCHLHRLRVQTHGHQRPCPHGCDDGLLQPPDTSELQILTSCCCCLMSCHALCPLTKLPGSTPLHSLHNIAHGCPPFCRSPSISSAAYASPSWKLKSPASSRASTS